MCYLHTLTLMQCIVCVKKLIIIYISVHKDVKYII